MNAPELDLPFDPASDTALRMAYQLLDYERYGISFETACADRGLRICLKNSAEVIHRKRNEARTPTPRRRRVKSSPR